MKLSDPLVIFTLSMIGLIGVLLLAAHQADEAGHRRSGLVLMSMVIAALVGVIIGPWNLAGLLFLAVIYALWLGVPVLGIVLLVRRLRRRHSDPPAL